MFNFISKVTHKAVVADLTAEIDSLARSLRDEQTRARTSGRMASEFLAERDAARIERDIARAALSATEAQLASANTRLARLTTRGPGGRFVKIDAPSYPIPGSAADMINTVHQTIS